MTPNQFNTSQLSYRAKVLKAKGVKSSESPPKVNRDVFRDVLSREEESPPMQKRKCPVVVESSSSSSSPSFLLRHREDGVVVPPVLSGVSREQVHFGGKEIQGMTKRKFLC
jgi:hypothetical protein